MTAPPAAAPADRLGPRQAAGWLLFAALVVLGLALWIRFADRIVPMLDVLAGR